MCIFLHINLRFISAELGALDLRLKLVSRSISCESIDGLGSYFAYILLLTIPSLVLSHDIFRQFSAELLTLIIRKNDIHSMFCEIMDRFRSNFASLLLLAIYCSGF